MFDNYRCAHNRLFLVLRFCRPALPGGKSEGQERLGESALVAKHRIDRRGVGRGGRQRILFARRYVRSLPGECGVL